MPKFLDKLQNWWLSFCDSFSGKPAGSAKEKAAIKQADYRTLLAKDEMLPITVGQVRRIASPDTPILIFIPSKPMCSEILLESKNKYLLNQYNDCEIADISIHRAALCLTLKAGACRDAEQRFSYTDAIKKCIASGKADEILNSPKAQALMNLKQRLLPK